MDVISMHQAGFDQAVASLGTAFTLGQASLLKRYTKEVLLSYDSDGAGVKAALRAIGILKEAGLTGKIISLEPYKDPDEFMKNLGKGSVPGTHRPRGKQLSFWKSGCWRRSTTFLIRRTRPGSTGEIAREAV